MTSSSSSKVPAWSRTLTIVLVVTTLGMFASTALLYWQQERSRQALAVSIRTSGWVAYQAQLELVKSLAALRIATLDPSASEVDNVHLRLAILRSRLPLLYDSEEGRLLPDIENYASLFKRYENLIDDFLDGQHTQNTFEMRGEMERLANELDDLLPPLQTVLQSAIAYNDEIYRREQELANNSAIVPLSLLFLSGGLLIVFLFVQTVRDRNRLLAVQEAEAEAEVVRTNLRALIEAIPAVVIVYDTANRQISFINGFALALINPSPDHPDWQRFMEAAQTVLSTCSQSSGWGSFTFQREDGSIIALRGSCRSVMWERRPQCLFALGDTTQIQDAEYQIMQAAKLSTLGEMASAIAHEINQPLAVIRMAAANARRHLANGEIEPVSAKLARIDEQVERAKRITDQVRRYGRKPSLRSSRFPLSRAIDLAIGFVAEQYRMASIRLNLDLDFSPDAEVEGEQTLFEQVIVNLLLNARDAFEMSDIPEAARAVSISGTSSESDIRLIVEDTAGGIPTEILSDIFEPFTTTKPDDKGTGLGLSLSRSIVRKMSGEIVATNVPGGACFTISLPAPRPLELDRSAA
ncbi:sensor histidine kinase [Amorphus sp. 3PC139-8]|uniref:sensor histidine kinase n=1 Tax=Amorphus sp. 3PC139-8 TaxID=2735676 RepID=UPI00345D9378